AAVSDVTATIQTKPTNQPDEKQTRYSSGIINKVVYISFYPLTGIISNADSAGPPSFSPHLPAPTPTHPPRRRSSRSGPMEQDPRETNRPPVPRTSGHAPPRPFPRYPPPPFWDGGGTVRGPADGFPIRFRLVRSLKQ
ncbi:hypothetical protein GWI33_012607, partial [Rhynchophorus ferrugineus]